MTKLPTRYLEPTNVLLLQHRTYLVSSVWGPSGERVYVWEAAKEMVEGDSGEAIISPQRRQN